MNEDYLLLSKEFVCPQSTDIRGGLRLWSIELAGASQLLGPLSNTTDRLVVTRELPDREERGAVAGRGGRRGESEVWRRRGGGRRRGKGRGSWKWEEDTNTFKSFSRFALINIYQQF